MKYSELSINDLEAMKITVKRECMDECLCELELSYYIPLSKDTALDRVCVYHNIAEDFKWDDTDTDEIEDMVYLTIGNCFVNGFEDNYYINEVFTLDRLQTEEYYYTYRLMPVFSTNQ